MRFLFSSNLLPIQIRTRAQLYAIKGMTEWTMKIMRERIKYIPLDRQKYTRAQNKRFRNTQIRFMKCLLFVLFFLLYSVQIFVVHRFTSSLRWCLRYELVFFVDSTDSHPGLSNREEKKWFSYFDCSNTLQQQHSCESLSCATTTTASIKCKIVAFNVNFLNQMLLFTNELTKCNQIFRKFHWNFNSFGCFGCKMVVIPKISDNLAVATNTHRHTHVVEKRIQFFANE